MVDTLNNAENPEIGFQKAADIMSIAGACLFFFYLTTMVICASKKEDDDEEEEEVENKKEVDVPLTWEKKKLLICLCSCMIASQTTRQNVLALLPPFCDDNFPQFKGLETGLLLCSY